MARACPLSRLRAWLRGSRPSVLRATCSIHAGSRVRRASQLQRDIRALSFELLSFAFQRCIISRLRYDKNYSARSISWIGGHWIKERTGMETNDPPALDNLILGGNLGDPLGETNCALFSAHRNRHLRFASLRPERADCDLALLQLREGDAFARAAAAPQPGFGRARRIRKSRTARTSVSGDRCKRCKLRRAARCR